MYDEVKQSSEELILPEHRGTGLPVANILGEGENEIKYRSAGSGPADGNGACRDDCFTGGKCR
ncbi:hypothetical protein JCM10550A_13680 [Methanogenium cariaci]